jgi:hypothetical protein
MKELVYNVKVATRDALLGRILDAAEQIRNVKNLTIYKIQNPLIKNTVNIIQSIKCIKYS